MKKLTVADLIAMLGKFPPDEIVHVPQWYGQDVAAAIDVVWDDKGYVDKRRYVLIMPE